MPVWEIVNPSDPYTIKHDSLQAAAAAVLILGEGRYGLNNLETDEQDLPLLFFGGGDEYIAKTFGGDLVDWIAEPAHKVMVIEALDSVLLGRADRRKDFDAAIAAIDDPQKLAAFKDAWQDKRSSLNDIGGRAYKLAEHMRGQL